MNDDATKQGRERMLLPALNASTIVPIPFAHVADHGGQ